MASATPVGCLQIAAGPLGEAEERRSRSAPEMVARWQEIKRPLTVRHGAGEIAARLGKVGMGRGNRRRERPQLRFVHDYDRGPWGIQFRAVRCAGSSSRSASPKRASAASSSPPFSSAQA